MKTNGNTRSFLNTTTVFVVGVLLVVFSAALLLWYGNAHSMQAMPAMTAHVYFDGDYRIADGEWQKIEEGQHIPSTRGDVTLRGNFHLLAPDGKYVGVYDGDTPIAFYTNHVCLTIREGDFEPIMLDGENPMFGASSCNVDWQAYSFTFGNTEPIEILIRNPHRFGNENAVDELLANTALWTGMEFQKSVMDQNEAQNNIGLVFLIVSLVVLGIALFSTLIHIKNSKLLWVLGIVIMFAGLYLIYSTNDIVFRSESVVSNTIVLGSAMMLYMLFLSIAQVHFLRVTKKAGTVTVTVLGVADAVLFMLPILTDTLFYDTWLYWAILQILVNTVLLGCLIKEVFAAKGKERLLYIGAVLPLVAFAVDVLMTMLGTWQGGLASVCVFIVFFVMVMVAVLRIIPHSINALAKARELETEKIVLNAQLTESRMSTMMSQIRPHFIYNTLGSIEQLCVINPPKAKELVHNFSKYLRGNFGELDNPKPILMSQEMEHVHHYLRIENVRFPDMTFLFEMHSNDFHIPALTVQPIVENAIKHGLMKLEKGGTIRVTTYETDTEYGVLVEDNGAGFDTSELLDDRKHVGIRNIRGRLEAMVNGKLEIESTVGVGTKVRITIPKEA